MKIFFDSQSLSYDTGVSDRVNGSTRSQWPIMLDNLTSLQAEREYYLEEKEKKGSDKRWINKEVKKLEALMAAIHQELMKTLSALTHSREESIKTVVRDVFGY